ncbi:hypothetical protein MNB_ARC-1_860 [hydrothermal vent metagenome]|uniref:HlyD family secretion protein n=1 Tax=hydrothermal vent metagenome TaxID=652676 RepID=A0A3B1E6C8_9ZZZZ
MRIIYYIFILTIFVDANEYFAKLQPIETYNIKASTSGKVVFVNEKIKGLSANNSIILKLDSKVDNIDLKQTIKKLNVLSQIIKIERNILNKFKSIRSKSQFDKDNQKIKIFNLENKRSDLIIKKAILEDKINKKKFKEFNKYISNINVKVGDYVNPGAFLYTANNISKSKLEIYIPIEKANLYKQKTIYIDDKKTKYTISKLYKISDTKNLSSYKCEIIVDAPKQFSKLVKIEFK